MKIRVENPNNLPLYRWRDLVPLQQTAAYNLKDRTDEQTAALWASIQQFGFFVPFYIWLYDGRQYIIDGHQRQGVLLLHEVENEELPGLAVEAESLAEAKKKLLVITSQYATVTPEGFARFTAELPDLWVNETVSFDALRFEAPALPPLPAPPSRLRPERTIPMGGVRERFIMPPFSILDARSGPWGERKQAWLALNIASFEGRADDLTFAESARPGSFYDLKNKMREEAGGVEPSWADVNKRAEEMGMLKPNVAGTSIFDPVLAEVLYRWFNLPGGVILDPFAGGSVRGVVAGLLGFPYYGIDLRAEQIAANAAQWETVSTSEVLQPPVPDKYYGPHEHTPVLPFNVEGGLAYAKREDFACYEGPEYPSGSKVRQFMEMIKQHPAGTPLVVGCSAHSAQQIYIADAARRAGAPGVVFVPELKSPTAATRWAEANGAEIHTLKPGYPSQYRKAAKEYGKAAGGAIRWDVGRAVADTAEQCANLPREVQRVVIPTGSGLTAAGVLVGLAEAGRTNVKVLCVAVSPLAEAEKILALAQKNTQQPLPELELVRHPAKYETPAVGTLPDGTRLDPLYAAKALPWVVAGDCLWLSGIRPVAASPEPPKAAVTAQAVALTAAGTVKPEWKEGDSRNLPALLPEGWQADFVFSCPPYADLEVYSDNPADLSTMKYPAFVEAYREIIAHAAARLKPNRFACFVVGEVRDKKGAYYGFVQDTINAFEAAGLVFYNEAILVTQVGSNGVRITRQFQAGRKMGKTHQNVLVFYNGDPKNIKAEFGDVDLGLPEEPEAEAPAGEGEHEPVGAES